MNVLDVLSEISLIAYLVLPEAALPNGPLLFLLPRSGRETMADRVATSGEVALNQPPAGGLWVRLNRSTPLARRRVWDYLSPQPLSQFILGQVQIVVHLQSQPELRRHVKEARQA